MLLTLLLLANELGPVPQGQFSKVKAEVEFIAALVMLGFPQSLFFFMQSGRMTLASSRRWCAWVGCAAGVGGVLFGSGRATESAFVVVAMAAATAAFAWHGTLRGVVLATAGTRTFNITTTFPQVFLLAFAIGAVWAGALSTFASAVAFALAFTAGSLLGLKPSTTRPEASAHSPRLREVVMFGLTAGVAALGVPCTTFVLVHAVDRALGASALGVFALSLTIAQGVLVPLNYVVPLLFKRWMEYPGESRPHLIGGSAALALAALAGASALLAFVDVAEGWVGPYGAMKSLLPILLLASSVDAYQRTLAVDANARGVPSAPALAELTRIATLVAIAFLIGPSRLVEFGWAAVAASMGSLLSLAALHGRLSTWTR